MPHPVPHQEKQTVSENQCEHPIGIKKPIKKLCTLPAYSQKSLLKLISKEIPFPKVLLGGAGMTHCAFLLAVITIVIFNICQYHHWGQNR